MGNSCQVLVKPQRESSDEKKEERIKGSFMTDSKQCTIGYFV